MIATKHVFIFVIVALAIAPLTGCSNNLREAPAPKRDTEWTTVFEAKTCCDLSPPKSGSWLRIEKAPLEAPIAPSSEFRLLFSQRRANTEKVLFSKHLGYGGWCHTYFYNIGAAGITPYPHTGPSTTDSVLFVWVEGQATGAFAFLVSKNSIKTVFEQTEGRSWYSLQDIDCDGTFEIIQHDTGWHLIGWGDSLQDKLKAKLDAHYGGGIIYKFDGTSYQQFDSRREDADGHPIAAQRAHTSKK